MQNQQNEKLKQQTTQIFNIAEKPIMEYITMFLEETSDTTFTVDIPNKLDPLILLPMDDYKKNIYLRFTLKPIQKTQECDKTRVQTINNIIEYKNVKEAIGFLQYCIQSVYPAIIASSMVNNKPMINTSLELNENEWSFNPIFKHNSTIKREFLEDALSKFIYLKKEDKTLTDSSVKEYNTKIQDISKKLSEVMKDTPTDSLEIEKSINIKYQHKPVIGIYVDEITKDQLPKIKQPVSQLPKISNKAYE